MNIERQLEKLTPAEIGAIKKEAAILYIPLGAFEWHGPHLPVGNDALKIHKTSLLTAKKTGGGVLPPFYLGFSNSNNDDKYKHGFHIYDFDFFVEMLKKMFSSMVKMDFKLYVPFIGHTPLEMVEAVEKASQAISEQYGAPFFPLNEMEIGLRILGFTESFSEICRNWKYEYYQKARNAGLYGGDHAAFGETSMLLYLYPDLVHLENLPEADCATPKQRRETLGISGESPLSATAMVGERMVKSIVEYASNLVNKRYGKVTG